MLGKTHVLIFILVFLNVFQLNARSIKQLKVDSLKRLLLSAQTSTEKVPVLNELAWEYLETDIAIAKNYARSANKLADSSGLLADLAISYNRLGTVYKLEGNYKEALFHFQKALQTEMRIAENDYGVARGFNNLAIAYQELGGYDSAMIASQSCISMLEAKIRKDSVNVDPKWWSAAALAAQTQGRTYQFKGKNDEALQYYYKAHHFAGKVDAEALKAGIKTSIGQIYALQQFYAKAIETFKGVRKVYQKYNHTYGLAQINMDIGNVFLAQHELDSAIVYYESSRSFYQQHGAQAEISKLTTNLGSVYHAAGLWFKARQAYLEALMVVKASKDIESQAKLLKNLGSVSLNLQDTIHALKYFEQSLGISDSIGLQTVAMELLRTMADLSSGLKQYDLAVEYNKRYNALRDSIEKSNRELILIKDQFEQVHFEKGLQEERIRRQQLWLYILVVGFVFFALLGTLLYRSVVQQKQALETERKLERVIKQQEEMEINAMLEGQESERKRIGEDLHDGLGGMLATVKLHFKSVEDHLESIRVENLEQYKKANDLLDEACNVVRKISHDMATGLLIKDGLVSSIKKLCKTIEDTKRLEIEFVNHAMDVRLVRGIELIVYMIIRELVTNVLKHANATRASIQLNRFNNVLNLVVEDDGVGFNMEDEAFKRGLGIVNLQKRVAKLNGKIAFDSGQGNGTSVMIDIPINDEFFEVTTQTKRL